MNIRQLNEPRKRYLAGILEMACQALEPTKTQYEDAKSKYVNVGEWLDDSTNPILAESLISPQGSMRLGTAVKPLWQDEFDVDLVCFLMHANENMGARYLKKLVGDRLRENGRYAPILQEKQRCWRLNFAGQFHMDITPAVKNPRCKNGGLLVPDKDLDQSMKPSNPEGYAQWFEDRAELAPIRFGDSHVEIRRILPHPNWRNPLPALG